MLNHSRVVNESTQSLSNRFKINNARVQLFSLLLSIYSIQHPSMDWIQVGSSRILLLTLHGIDYLTLRRANSNNRDGIQVKR